MTLVWKNPHTSYQMQNQNNEIIEKTRLLVLQEIYILLSELLLVLMRIPFLIDKY